MARSASNPATITFRQPPLPPITWRPFAWAAAAGIGLMSLVAGLIVLIDLLIVGSLSTFNSQLAELPALTPMASFVAIFFIAIWEMGKGRSIVRLDRDGIRQVTRLRIGGGASPPKRVRVAMPEGIVRRRLARRVRWADIRAVELPGQGAIRLVTETDTLGISTAAFGDDAEALYQLIRDRLQAHHGPIAPTPGELAPPPAPRTWRRRILRGLIAALVAIAFLGWMFSGLYFSHLVEPRAGTAGVIAVMLAISAPPFLTIFLFSRSASARAAMNWVALSAPLNHGHQPSTDS
jgi:hypothetical protein